MSRRIHVYITIHVDTFVQLRCNFLHTVTNTTYIFIFFVNSSRTDNGNVSQPPLEIPSKRQARSKSTSVNVAPESAARRNRSKSYHVEQKYDKII